LCQRDRLLSAAIGNDVRKRLDGDGASGEDLRVDLDHNACYRAIELHEARFDGRFFTAVKTTDISCRPVCPARTPRSENVISLVRPVTPDTGLVRAEGSVISRGRRIGTAEGRLIDTKGRILAHGTTTCPIFEY